MFQKDANSALRDNFLGRFRLATRNGKAASAKLGIVANDPLFTNQAILTSIHTVQKNLRLKRISFKKASFKEDHNYCEFFKISSLASRVENFQNQQKKQNLSNAKKINNMDILRYLGIRPKSAVCRSSGHTDFKYTKICKQINQSQMKESQLGQLVHQLGPGENKKVSKQPFSKDTRTGKISLFTCNSNVFIPRANNKYYGSYLTKSNVDEIKLMSRQVSSKQNENKLKRNTVSNINQKELQEKCGFNLDLDSKPQQITMSIKSVRRKKIEYSQKQLHLFSPSHSQSIKTFLQQPKAQVKGQKNNKNSRQSFSQRLDSNDCENLKNVFKTVQLNKKQSNQLKSRKSLKPKYKAKSKKRQGSSLSQQRKMIQPTNFTKMPQFAVGRQKKQKDYYSATCPDSSERNALNLLVKQDASSKIQKKKLRRVNFQS